MAAGRRSQQYPADQDLRWLRMALSLARRRLGQVAPNPAVAALIVKDGRIIGRGITGAGGRPHAEVRAIDQAKVRFGIDALQGATAHISFEPCAHHGRTPPCADALIDAGIGCVVSTIEDPDPRVAGQGFERLRAAGVHVISGKLETEARCVNAGFLSRLERGRPFLTLKIATTVDGRIATMTGESRWITGPGARHRVHLMRAQSDAIMVGAGTARTDDPELNIRGFNIAAERHPVRIVVDGSLSLPYTSQLARSARQIPLWLMHQPQAPAERTDAYAGLGAKLIETDSGDDSRLSMSDGLRKIADLGVTRLLCEGGGRLSAALLSAGLVDRLVIFQAGKVFGGDGVPSVASFGLTQITDAPGLTLVSSELIGGDFMSVWEHSSSSTS